MQKVLGWQQELPRKPEERLINGSQGRAGDHKKTARDLLITSRLFPDEARALLPCQMLCCQS